MIFWTTGTEVENLLLFKQGAILLFRSPGVPLRAGGSNFEREMENINILSIHAAYNVNIAYHMISIITSIPLNSKH